jgi:hypothetical protein
MNRSERRRLVKNGVTAKDLLNLQHTEGMYAVKQTVHDYSVAVASILHDKLGFGTTRLECTLTDISELFDGINKGYVSIEDLEKTLKEETGVVMQDKE